MKFTWLEQRMAHTYQDTFPPFVPSPIGPAPELQEAFYRQMERLYALLFGEPTLLVPELHADDAYPNRFNKSSYGKPKLQDAMRKYLRETDNLLAALWQLAAGQTPKLTRRQQVVLARAGFDPANLPEAARWLAIQPGTTPFAFSRCLFRPDYPYASDVYAGLLGDTVAFRRLEDWLAAHGYRRYTTLRDGLSLDWANPAWDAAPPRGGFEFKVRHTGVSCAYDPLVQQPAVLGLCIPGGMKESLLAFDRMEAPLQAFVARQTKTCDGCGYCTQTDKTGHRPRAFVTVDHNGNRLPLCTYFPGYSYWWTELNDNLVDSLIAFLGFLDGLRQAG